jgi:L-serine dehydratase
VKMPSILNEVIGPVMRGPSSSHSAAAVRIGCIARALMGNDIDEVLVEFDETGSLPTTYSSQGSGMGLCGGLLGFAASDERLIAYREEMDKSKIQIRYAFGNYGDSHPNTYRLTLKNKKGTRSLVGISTGGGMIKIIEVDGVKLSIQGDLYETLIYFTSNEAQLSELVEGGGWNFTVGRGPSDRVMFVHLQSGVPLTGEQLRQFRSLEGVAYVAALPPVLPILTKKDLKIPFSMPGRCWPTVRPTSLWIWPILPLYMKAPGGGISQEEVLVKMVEIVRIIQKSIKEGLKGTSYEDRILGFQSGKYLDGVESSSLMDLGVLDTIIPYVTALMEVKSSMGVVVAAPTAGSCGGLPGSIIGVADRLGLGEKQVARAMLAAGLIGVFVAKILNLFGGGWRLPG